MAKYGQPTEDYIYPLGFKGEPNADMTYTGVRTSIISSVRIKLTNNLYEYSSMLNQLTIRKCQYMRESSRIYLLAVYVTMLSQFSLQS